MPIPWLTRALADMLYIQIRVDQLSARSITSGAERTAIPSAPFSTARLLVGDFDLAVATLTPALRAVRSRPLAPLAVVHPLERIEGGVSQVERICLIDMVLNAGAQHCQLWEGPPLSDAEVRRLIEGAR